mgnify:CR=1 FL=1
MSLVCEFLEAHRQEAFSLYELGMALGGSRDGFLEAIHRLVSLGIVNERAVGETLYYAKGRYSLTEILGP